MRGAHLPLAARAVDSDTFHRGIQGLLVGHVALDGVRADLQQLARVIALHRKHVGLELEGLGVGQAKCVVFGCVQVVGVVQGGDDTLGSRARCVEHAVGQKPRAIQRDLALEARSRIVLDELDRAATGEKAAHRVGLERGDLGQKGLEFDVGEGQAQLLDDGAARCGVALFKALKGFVASGVFPGDPHRFFMAFVHHGFANRAGRLRVGERGAKHVGCAQGAGGCVYASVGDDAEHAAVTRDFLNAHLHAGVHGADDYIDLVALHQLVGVFNALGWLGFVIDLEPFDLAATELAAFFFNGKAKAVFNRHAQRSKGSCVGQHQAHTNLAALGAGHRGQQKAGGRCANEGGTAGNNEATGGHGGKLQSEWRELSRLNERCALQLRQAAVLGYLCAQALCREHDAQ